MLTNGYIDIGIVIVILRIMPTNPKTFWNAYGFTFILKKKGLKQQSGFKVTDSFLSKYSKNLVQNYLKKRKKTWSKNWNSNILSTFWPYIFWTKLLKSVQIL